MLGPRDPRTIHARAPWEVGAHAKSGVVAPAIVCRAHWASDLFGLDASRPYHSNDRGMGINSIPKDRWNVVRFRVDSTGNHGGACPVRHFAWSARSLLTTVGTASAIPLSGRPHATRTAEHRSTNFPVMDTKAALPSIAGAASARR